MEVFQSQRSTLFIFNKSNMTKGGVQSKTEGWLGLN